MTGVEATTRPKRGETCLIVGGSSGLGRALAERFAAQGYAVVLISSDRRDLDALAADLALRFGIEAASVSMDLCASQLALEELERSLEAMPPLSVVLAPAGVNSDDDGIEQASSTREALLRGNFGSLCQIISHCLPRLTAAPAALIVGFGSVAAVRGRSRNVAYSAAKRALQCYFESLRHALSEGRIEVQFYVLGYLDTNLAFGKRTPIRRASPIRLAEYIYRRRADSFGVKHYPAIWRPICAVVRWLPWSVFRRLQF